MSDEQLPGTAPVDNESTPSASPPPANPGTFSRRSVYLISGAVLAAILVVVGVVVLVTQSGSSKVTIHGEMGLFQNYDSSLDSNYVASGGVCSGAGGYDDITEGANIEVDNSTGAVIGTGSLGPGHPLKGGICKFTFTVTDLPKSKYYKVEISHRGFVTFSAAEVQKTVTVTLGQS